MPVAVDVEWLDSSHQNGWSTDPKPSADMRCYTRGWLISETIDHVLVSAHATASRDGGPIDQFNCPMTIPRRAITRLRKRK